MKKAPSMPRLEPEEGDIERHTAYTRLNPNGDKELVVSDDEETLNEIAESLQEGVEEYIWKRVQEMLPEKLRGKPEINDKIDIAIGHGDTPEEIIAMLESIDFSGPLPIGGGVGSSEQLQTDRKHNRPDPPLMVSFDGDQERANQDDLNNMTSNTVRSSDGPEELRAKSKYKANSRGNEFPIKDIAGYRGDGLDLGVTHSESFTGTGAIAMPPGIGYNIIDDDDEDDEDDDDKLTENDKNTQYKSVESIMNHINLLTEEIDQIIAEWEPSFKGSEYNPGDYQMPSASGNGVAGRKTKKEKIGSYDTNTSNQGKEWPRNHNETAAMGSVDDDGAENKSQGSHESSVGEPIDGYQEKLGHNWPDKAKNTGSGVSEPFEGNRWSDGGVLKGSGQDETTNNGANQKLPSDGPITGVSGPQMGQMESWSPNNIGSLMDGDFDLQNLFDNYAKDYGRIVCLEDFQALCNAHGCKALLNDRSLLQLMEANEQFVFYQGEDANGYYWQPTPISNRDISELHVRSPEREVAGEYNINTFGASQGDPHFDNNYDEMLDTSDSLDNQHGPGHYGDHNQSMDTCPECGDMISPGEEDCPNCGAHVNDQMDLAQPDAYGRGGELDAQNVDDEDEFLHNHNDDFEEDDFEEDDNFEDDLKTMT